MKRTENRDYFVVLFENKFIYMTYCLTFLRYDFVTTLCVLRCIITSLLFLV